MASIIQATPTDDPSAQVLDVQALSTFKFERVLSESEQSLMASANCDFWLFDYLEAE